MLNFDTNYLSHKTSRTNIIKKYQKSVSSIFKKINSGTALGCEMTG